MLSLRAIQVQRFETTFVQRRAAGEYFSVDAPLNIIRTGYGGTNRAWSRNPPGGVPGEA